MPPRNLLEGVVHLPIATINQTILPPPSETADLSQRDAITLTSYDLLPTNATTGAETIVVPGHPRTWTPPPLPTTLAPPPSAQPEIVEAFPAFPMEPLFAAMSLTAPHTPATSFDIITDRRNLRLLFDFVSGRARNEDWRFDVEVVGDTLVFSRWIDWSTRTRPAGYGLPFEHAFTTAQVADSLVHKRAEGYSLGGLRLLVRFEVDACLPSTEGMAGVRAAVAGGGGDVRTCIPGGHSIIRGGMLVDAATVAELKSQARPRQTMGDAYAQMWFSRTPVLCQAVRRRDVVQSVEVEHVAFEDWVRDNRERLGKLVAVLAEIRELVRSECRAGQRFAVVRPKAVAGVVQLHRLQENYSFRMPSYLRAELEAQSLTMSLEKGLDLDKGLD